jgi:bacterial/archaeal transporter family-2 protein
MDGQLAVLAFAAGVLLIIQVGVNATLRHGLGTPVAAALMSFLVGSVALLVFLFATRSPWPGRAQLAAAPLWAWLGGFLGAFYVVSTIIVGPRLGAAAMLALIVLGQLTASLLVDHFGWLGFPRHALTPLRLCGAALLFGGVLLIVRRT